MFEEFAQLLVWLISIVLLAVIILPQMIRILREYERGVIFRLGKLLGTKGPGLIFLIPIVDRMVRMHLRVVTIDVARQELMTRDNVPVTVDAVVYFRVVDAASAVVRVENYLKATSLISQTTLRSVLGQAELDELLSQRDDGSPSRVGAGATCQNHKRRSRVSGRSKTRAGGIDDFRAADRPATALLTDDEGNFERA